MQSIVQGHVLDDQLASPATIPEAIHVPRDQGVATGLTATEVDLFMNDVGKSSQDLVIACPAPGSDKTVKEVDISA